MIIKHKKTKGVKQTTPSLAIVNNAARPLPVILRRAKTSVRLEISAPEEEMLLEQRKEEAIEQLLNGLHFFSPLQLLLFQGVIHPAGKINVSPPIFAAGFRMTG